jgi:hypothetical protein
MKEQLISFETAKLAKEKGFDWQTRDGYHSDLQDNDFWEDWDLYLSDHYNKRLISQGVYSAPTQSLLQKWLREVHEIHININTFYFEDLEKYGYEVEDIIHKDGWMVLSNTAGTYEEALEFGLQEALKLISYIKV